MISKREDWRDYANEIHPLTSVTPHNGRPTTVEEIHTGGGIVEVDSEAYALESSQLIISCLGAVGLSDREIAETLSYNQKSMGKIQSRIYRHLGAKNRLHAIKQMYTKRIFRAISSVEEPELSYFDTNLIAQLANGQTASEINSQYELGPTGAQHASERILKRFGVLRMSRAVMLGCAANTLQQPGISNIDYTLAEHDTLTVRQYSANDDDYTKLHSIDYVTWGDGQFSFAAKTALSPMQQHVLTLIATGHSDKEMVSLLGVSRSRLHWNITSMHHILKSESRSHAVFRAIESGEIRVTRPFEFVHLNRNELRGLELAAIGLRSREGAESVGITADGLRGRQMNAMAKLNVTNIASAVTKAYMSGLMSTSTITGTSVAPPPSGRQ